MALQRLAPTKTEQELRVISVVLLFTAIKSNRQSLLFPVVKSTFGLALIVWQRPNLLLLDEPTNHLDLDMRQALTEALMDYEGSLVVVSHDRHLLRNTVSEFYLVHDKKVEVFDGDLEDYQKWLLTLESDADQQVMTSKLIRENEFLQQKDKNGVKRNYAKKQRQLEKQFNSLKKKYAAIFNNTGANRNSISG